MSKFTIARSVVQFGDGGWDEAQQSRTERSLVLVGRRESMDVSRACTRSNMLASLAADRREQRGQ
jgi:hypothetical protein